MSKIKTWKQFNKEFKKLKIDNKANFRIVRSHDKNNTVVTIYRYLRNTKTLKIVLVSYGVLLGIECSSVHSTDGHYGKIFKLNQDEDNVIDFYFKMIKKLIKYKPNTDLNFWD